MIKPLIIDTILVDIFLNEVYQFTVNEFTHLDIRRQICEQSLEGYTMKINPQFWNLYDEDDKIIEHVVKINTDGEIDNWFPKYKLNDDYGYVDTFGQDFSAVLKIRRLQSEKKKDRKDGKGTN
jgi:hypothetical protein